MISLDRGVPPFAGAQKRWIFVGTFLARDMARRRIAIGQGGLRRGKFPAHIRGLRTAPLETPQPDGSVS